MKIGYACQCFRTAIPSFRTCTKKYVSEELLTAIVRHNLIVLDQILDYNYEHGIQLFRLSSDLIPFGSSPVNTISWHTMFQDEFHSLGEKARRYGIRLTMHPGQYTILNTPNEDVLQRSILDLRYHCDILNLMELDQTSKLILHIGGIYGDKEQAMHRFISVFQTLDQDIQQRLIIENDDRYFTLKDVMQIAEQVKIPVIFDNLHHELLPSFSSLSLYDTLKMVETTWKPEDGRMKIHYSQQDPVKRKGAHATFLNGQDFLTFCHQIQPLSLDMMMEIKTKNFAALQAIDLIKPDRFDASKVWSLYRYCVLRSSKELCHVIDQCHACFSAAQLYKWIYVGVSLPYVEQGDVCYQEILQEWDPYLDDMSRKKLTRAIQRYQENKLSEQGIRNAFYAVSPLVHHEEDLFFLY